MTDTMRDGFEKFVADFSECEIELIRTRRNGTSYDSFELSKSYIVWKAAQADAQVEREKAMALVGELQRALHLCLRKGAKWHPCDEVVIDGYTAITKAQAFVEGK